MTFKAVKFAFVALLATASSAMAGNITMTASPGTARTQTQGMGTYDVYDFFLTMAPEGTFSNYTINALATAGNLADPARLQDDRQVQPQTGAANGNTLGHVDLWVNTPFSAAGKEDGGTPASITPNPAFYQPTGSGAAPLFTQLSWLVFDQQTNDDNDLNDHPETPLPATAPYHIARILATPNGTGTVNFELVETGGAIQPFAFTYGAVVTDVDPMIIDEVDPVGINANDPGTYTNDMQLIDPDDVAHTWAVGSVNYVPGFPGAGPPPAGAGNPTIDNNGLFSWTTLGLPRGVYTWSLTATDADGTGSDAGTLTVNINAVPEPGSIALFGIAMVGGLGLFRRRNG
jgi:hypothetical protein